MPGGSVTIAVISTCHNQRSLVIECLRALFAQCDDRTTILAYVVDDGSVDGTSEALAAVGANVTVLSGDGNLYWAAGMELAERSALKSDPDALLWLNVDTVLDPDGLQRLMESHARQPDAIIVGATRDPDTGKRTYGGRRKISSWHPQRFEPLPIMDDEQLADTFNGNVVLVPRSAREVVGPIDGLFPHAYADDDYGLRASRLGVPIVQVAGTVATCRPNEPAAAYRRGPAAWRSWQQPKGLPYRAQVRYLRRHGGRAWPVVLFAQQASVFLGLRAVKAPQ